MLVAGTAAPRTLRRRPERPTVVGSTSPNPSSTSSAVRAALLDNASLDKISTEQLAGQLPLWQTSLVNPGFAEFARSCGATGIARCNAWRTRLNEVRGIPPVRRPKMTDALDDFAGLRALFINCTLKRSPEPSNTQGLIDISTRIMEKHGIAVEVVRAIDHDVATGVWPDMREHGWATDDWPALFDKVLAADILVLAGPIWLGDNSSVMKKVHERLYGGSHLLNDAGQYLYYGRVGGCLITGNEDGVKHCAQNVLYTLQHIGYTIPPQADAGWIGEAGPGPSYLDPGSGGPENDFTNRNTTFMTWNLMHFARMLRAQGGIPAYGNVRSGWDAGCRYDFANPEYR